MSGMQRSLGTVRHVSFLLLLAAVSLFFIWMVRDFLFPVFWAVVFAVLLRPLYAWLVPYARFAWLSALLSILVACLVILVPLGLIGASVVQEVHFLYTRAAQSEMLANAVLSPAVSDALAAVNVDTRQMTAEITNAVRTGSAWLLSQALLLGSATAGLALQTAVMLYLLFFLLKDGDRVIRYAVRRLPFEEAVTERLFSRFAVTARATIKGTAVIAVLQGVAGWLIFLAAGVPSALVWGVLMGLLGFLPAVGPFLIWVPATAILFATGAFVPAFIVLLGSLLIVGPIDTFLRPVLIEHDTRIPNPLVFLAAFGGISVFGIAGLIIGPVAAALLLAAWDVFAATEAGGAKTA